MGAQGADHGRRVERSHVDTQLDRHIALYQRREPAGGDSARVGGEGQYACVLAVQPEVVVIDIARARRHQIGQGAAAQRQQALVAGQAPPGGEAARLGRLGRAD